MGENYRKSDFKLGALHGKVSPTKVASEAAIQRKLFLSQSIKIVRSSLESRNTCIRLIAYEMPLGYHRDLCVDLVGYDADHNLYLIELKAGTSSEKLPQVMDQIGKYACIVKEIKGYIEKDFEKTFYFPLKIKDIKKVILAPRKFYDKKTTDYSNSNVEHLVFSDKDIDKDDLKRALKPLVRVHIHKRKVKK